MLLEMLLADRNHFYCIFDSINAALVSIREYRLYWQHNSLSKLFMQMYLCTVRCRSVVVCI